MVEKIIVSRDEVLHYSWNDHTWVYIYYPVNSITKNSHFVALIEMILKRGISEATGTSFENLEVEGDYVFVRYDTDEIIEILKNACTWILKRNLIAKDSTSPQGAFFTENKETFNAFFEETRKMLEEKKYRYFFQRIDGMN